jgi:hypothetical protein
VKTGRKKKEIYEYTNENRCERSIRTNKSKRIASKPGEKNMAECSYGCHFIASTNTTRKKRETTSQEMKQNKQTRHWPSSREY